MTLLRLRRGAADGGFALVTVLGSMAVLTAFLLATLAYSVNAMPTSRRDQDAKAALAAAQAGIDDYVARLGVRDDYFLTTDSTNPALTGAGAKVGGGAASFVYEVLNRDQVAATGVLRLKVTGRAARVTRTLTATLQPIGFLKYVYYTDVEAQDPDLYADTWGVRVAGVFTFKGPGGKETFEYRSHPQHVKDQCSKYYYTGRSSPFTYTSSTATPIIVWNVTKNVLDKKITDGTQAVLGPTSDRLCADVRWPTGDVVDGPLHSNDALAITGSPLFKDARTETSWADTANPPPPTTGRWWGSGTPSSSGFRPVYYPPVALPSNPAALRNAAVTEGCVYSGATKIHFEGTSMRVWSPYTTTTKAGCWTAGAGSPQVVPVPRAVYVDNTSATCPTSGGNGVGFPVPGDAQLGKSPDHTCTWGNAYVQGSLSGRTTLGAANDVIISGNITYASGTTGSDVLGLVGANYVWISHPVDVNGNNVLSASAEVHHVHAAILSLNHSFLVQSWNHGPPVTAGGAALNVTGSISQKYRGPVSTLDSNGNLLTGYAKNYVYDKRLQSVPPPYFLQPERAPWQVVRVSG